MRGTLRNQNRDCVKTLPHAAANMRDERPKRWEAPLTASPNDLLFRFSGCIRINGNPVANTSAIEIIVQSKGVLRSPPSMCVVVEDICLGDGLVGTRVTETRRLSLAKLVRRHTPWHTRWKTQNPNSSMLCHQQTHVDVSISGVGNTAGNNIGLRHKTELATMKLAPTANPVLRLSMEENLRFR